MQQWKLRVNAGEHRRAGCPVMANLGSAPVGFESLMLTEERSGRRVPCQGGTGPQGQVMLHWMPDVLEAGESRDYIVKPCDAPTHTAEVQLKDDGSKVDVTIGGDPFTAYYYDAKWVRPFLWPVVGPFGDPVTRGYPMVADVEGEKHDHHHQKSLYTAFGDVNGVDDWSEEEGHGGIVHKGFTQFRGGPSAAVLQAANDWVGKEGKRVLSEQRTMIFYNLLPCTEKMVDFTVHFRADDGQVKIGDTKEGGILAVRVATTMDEDSGLGGKIENSFGGIGERETWGKPAHWCDYSGPVSGRRVGIAVMDHPSNLRHPTGWHVRAYGLMTANCFADSFYENDPTKDGSYVIPGGGELVFRYRLLIHRGDAAVGRVAQRYHDFINPPRVEVL